MQHRLRGEIARPALRGWHERGHQILCRLEDSFSIISITGTFMLNLNYKGASVVDSVSLLILNFHYRGASIVDPVSLLIQYP
jgi:hypothetical protein